MQTTTIPLVVPARLHSLAALAGLLERLERLPRQASAAQYRSVVQQLLSLLAGSPIDETLNAILLACPATATLYENLQYRHAGLCRQPLEAALAAETAAAALINRANASL
jgi:hypothetical protein